MIDSPLATDVCKLLCYRSAIVCLSCTIDDVLDAIPIQEWESHFGDSQFEKKHLSSFWQSFVTKEEHHYLTMAAHCSGLSYEDMCTFSNLFPPKFMEMSRSAKAFIQSGNPEYRLNIAHINQDATQMLSHAWLSNFLLNASNRSKNFTRYHTSLNSLAEFPSEKHLNFLSIIKESSLDDSTCDDIWRKIFADCNPNGHYEMRGISNQVFDDISDIFKDAALEKRLEYKQFFTPNIVLAYLQSSGFDYQDYYLQTLSRGKTKLSFADLPKPIKQVMTELSGESPYPFNKTFDVPDFQDSALDNPSSMKKSLVLFALSSIVNLHSFKERCF